MAKRTFVVPVEVELQILWPELYLEEGARSHALLFGGG